MRALPRSGGSCTMPASILSRDGPVQAGRSFWALGRPGSWPAAFSTPTRFGHSRTPSTPISRSSGEADSMTSYTNTPRSRRGGRVTGTHRSYVCETTSAVAISIRCNRSCLSGWSRDPTARLSRGRRWTTQSPRAPRWRPRPMDRAQRSGSSRRRPRSSGRRSAARNGTRTAWCPARCHSRWLSSHSRKRIREPMRSWC